MAKTQRFDHLQHATLFPGGDAVQVARWTGERIQITTDSAASAATPLPAGTKFVEIRAEEDCYLRFGDTDVVATQDANSVLFLRGAQAVPVTLDGQREPYTHVSVIRARAVNGAVQFERLY